MQKREYIHSLSQQSITVCALARNCESVLKANIARLTQLEKHFREVHYIIVENDSVDDTRTILEEWKTRNTNVSLPNVYEYFFEHKQYLQLLGIDLEILTIFKPSFENRIKRIALARSVLIDALAKDVHKPNYVCMIDLDLSKFSLQGVMQNVRSSDDWDVLAANCYDYRIKALKKLQIQRIYYDSFAVEKVGEQTKPFDEKFGVQEEFSKFHRRGTWVRVNSAFGGIALYKYEVIIDTHAKVRVPRISYVDAAYEDEFKICEHVSFHRRLREQGYDKIYIAPSLVSYYNTFMSALTKYIFRKREKTKKTYE